MRFKGTAILLAMVMVAVLFVAIPATVFAADFNTPDTVELFISGGTSQGIFSFNGALSNAVEPERYYIVLLDDISQESQVLLSQTIYGIRLNGHTLSVGNGGVSDIDTASLSLEVVGPGTINVTGGIMASGTIAVVQHAVANIGGSVTGCHSANVAIRALSSEVHIAGSVNAPNL
ncbi:MAG: hypothetical protein FWD41_05620, partial [Actinomycetia bacterium]|nr:hypothetical protein [Actinomycetes bacterium]